MKIRKFIIIIFVVMNGKLDNIYLVKATFGTKVKPIILFDFSNFIFKGAWTGKLFSSFEKRIIKKTYKRFALFLILLSRNEF
jgi:hypothetical protein